MARDPIDIEVGGPEGPLHNVVSPFEASGPNQLLMELIQNRENIESLVLVAREKKVEATPKKELVKSGPVEKLTAPAGVIAFGGAQNLTEATKTLDTTVGLELFEEHSKDDDEPEHPHLELSRVFNEYPDEDEDE